MPPSAHVPTALLACTFLAAACAGSEESDTAPPTEPTGNRPAMESPADSDDGRSDIPDSLVGRQARWVLERLSAGTGPDAAVAEERFSAEFLGQVPADAMESTFDQIRSAGPFVVDSYSGSEREAVLVLTGSGDSRWLLHVALDDADEIDTLFLQPTREAPDVTDWDELTAALADTGADVAVHAAREGGGSWEPLHEADAQPRPVGSIAKLYVLGAVQQAVLDGDLSWSDEIAVTDDLRSLPTGVLQEEPSGTDIPVAEVAEKMISISDNTATDMLIDLVGRAAVEDAVEAMNHHDPSLLRPFLTTRELFQLGWSDPALRERWRDAGHDGRRAILGDLPSGVLDVDPQAITDAVWPSGITWQATAADIASAHRALQLLAADDPSGTVRDLLAVNPGAGLDIDTGTWPYIAYKGGSAPGLLAFSWYAEDADGVGHTFVVQLAADDPAALADQMYIAGVVEQGFDLLDGG